MKKKILILVLAVVFFLSGCSDGSDYIEPEDRIIVSSLGIDSKNKKIILTAECINVNKNSNADEYNIINFTGAGNNFSTAICDLEKSADGDIIFSQCPVLILSTELSGKQIEDIFSYVAQNESIPLAIKVIATKSSRDLIKANKDKQPAGYQIMNLINFSDSTSGITNNDTVVEIIDGLYSDESIHKMPYIIYSDGYNIDGSAIFSKSGCNVIYNYTDAQLLYLLSNDLKKCKIVISDNVLQIKRTKSDFKSNGNINIEIVIENSKEINDFNKIESIIKEKIINVIEALRENKLLPIIEKESYFQGKVSVNVKISGEL